MARSACCEIRHNIMSGRPAVNRYDKLWRRVVNTSRRGVNTLIWRLRAAEKRRQRSVLCRASLVVQNGVAFCGGRALLHGDA